MSTQAPDRVEGPPEFIKKEEVDIQLDGTGNEKSIEIVPDHVKYKDETPINSDSDAENLEDVKGSSNSPKKYSSTSRSSVDNVQETTPITNISATTTAHLSPETETCHGDTGDTKFEYIDCNADIDESTHDKSSQTASEDADPTQPRMYKCSICDFATKYRNKIGRHELTHADPSDVQMYNCDLCDFTSKYKHNLKTHKLKHEDPSVVKMHKCDLCDFRTLYKNKLPRHKLTHIDPSVVPMYKCELCDLTTKHKNNLKLHQLTHKDRTEVELHKCDLCDFTTKHKKVLPRHRLVHEW